MVTCLTLLIAFTVITNAMGFILSPQKHEHVFYYFFDHNRKHYCKDKIYLIFHFHFKLLLFNEKQQKSL